eukprot:gnl/Chilomastix_caulleri/7454.p2 GENE.gnl/Chilomastix_caulleri/7454~~gnl/Chilomastix_caulleri/7454.p2  ORF type:complete len:51 (-),score=2.99 gnl/Chilomastix_caulleri/7454:131-283(-)
MDRLLIFCLVDTALFTRHNSPYNKMQGSKNMINDKSTPNMYYSSPYEDEF